MRLALFLATLATTIVSSLGEEAPPALYKGMTVSCQTWGIEWQMPEMEATLDELKSLGVNSIAIHPYAQIQNDGHVRFRLCRPDGLAEVTVSRSDSSYRTARKLSWGDRFPAEP